MASTDVQAVPGPAQSHISDVQRIGPGSAAPPPPPKPAGKGSAAGPSVTVAPPVRTSKPSQSQLDGIRSALDIWRNAASDLATTEKNLAGAPDADRVRLTNRRDEARNAASNAHTAFVQTVNRVIIDSCLAEKCTFASMRQAADAIANFVRTDEEQKVDAARRQSATGEAIYAVLLDAARASLRRPDTIEDVAAWVMQNPPQHVSSYSKLKALAEIGRASCRERV